MIVVEGMVASYPGALEGLGTRLKVWMIWSLPSLVLKGTATLDYCAHGVAVEPLIKAMPCSNFMIRSWMSHKLFRVCTSSVGGHAAQ